MIELRAEQLDALGESVPREGEPPPDPAPADGAGTTAELGPSVVVIDPARAGWFCIELTSTSGRPVPGAAWEVTLPDGRTVEGRLDVNGKTRLEGLEPGQCTVRFPEVDRPDRDVRVVGAAGGPA